MRAVGPRAGVVGLGNREDGVKLEAFGFRMGGAVTGGAIAGTKLLEDVDALAGGALEAGNRGASLLGSAVVGGAMSPKAEGVALENEGFGNSGICTGGWGDGTGMNEVEVEGWDAGEGVTVNVWPKTLCGVDPKADLGTVPNAEGVVPNVGPPKTDTPPNGLGLAVRLLNAD